jgi:hypothetical protein
VAPAAAPAAPAADPLDEADALAVARYAVDGLNQVVQSVQHHSDRLAVIEKAVAKLLRVALEIAAEVGVTL